MLYENYETDISKDNLVTVFSKVTAPLCLLGGWAVYLTVNVNYKNDKGRDSQSKKDRQKENMSVVRVITFLVKNIS